MQDEECYEQRHANVAQHEDNLDNIEADRDPRMQPVVLLKRLECQPSGSSFGERRARSRKERRELDMFAQLADGVGHGEEEASVMYCRRVTTSIGRGSKRTARISSFWNLSLIHI